MNARFNHVEKTGVKKGRNASLGQKRTYTAQVSHPTLPGHVERVQRVFDTIDNMYRRKQLDARCFHAAERLRRCYEIVSGVPLGNTMDFERVRGSKSANLGPADSWMEAAEVLRLAKRDLDGLSHRVITLICCQATSIEKTAEQIYHHVPERVEKERIGKVLKEALRFLSDQWWPSISGKDQRTIIVSHRSEGSRPIEAVAGVIVRGNTAHATGRKVFRS